MFDSITNAKIVVVNMRFYKFLILKSLNDSFQTSHVAINHLLEILQLNWLFQEVTEPDILASHLVGSSRVRAQCEDVLL